MLHENQGGLWRILARFHPLFGTKIPRSIPSCSIEFYHNPKENMRLQNIGQLGQLGDLDEKKSIA